MAEFKTTNYLLSAKDGVDFTRIDNHLAHNGFSSVKKALAMPKEAVLEEVKKANLRGRGGAGFLAGVKWGFIPKDSPKPKYLVVNADEGEPGTFKDRYFLEHAPFPLIEGCIIASYAIDAHTCFIYIRGEFQKQINVVENAISEAYRGGFLGKDIMGSGFSLDIFVHPGAGAYICGEETALLESIEGKPGRPRNRPPFPAIKGLFGCPTIVNNVETICCVSLIMNIGAEKFLELGLPKNGGPKLYSVSGHVKKPGLYELPMGFNLKSLIFDVCGGILNDRPLKAVIPGGVSTPVLRPDEIDIAMDFDSLRDVGSQFGTAAVIVISEGTCMVEVLRRISAFYMHESCGQCTPCREGTGWMYRIIDNLERGLGRSEDLELLEEIAEQITGRTICALGEAAAMPVLSFLRKFRSDFEEHVVRGGCPYKCRSNF